MNLANKKVVAAKLLKVGKSRVWFDPDRLDEIKEAITRADLNKLIKDLAIQGKPEIGISRGRTRKNTRQKSKGRRKGKGSKKGTKYARLPRKREWINHVRPQRRFIKTLKERKRISPSSYRNIYSKIKGGFFRSRRHIGLYLKEHDMFLKNQK